MDRELTRDVSVVYEFRYTSIKDIDEYYVVEGRRTSYFPE